MVIPGWDQGLEGAKIGARRQLTIPAKLAYGAQGSPPTIGPNEPLVFVIDVSRQAVVPRRSDTARRLPSRSRR